MSKIQKTMIDVHGTSVTVLTHTIDSYISLTDIAKYKEPDRSDHVIQNWMRNRNTIEFLGIWERLNNPVFKPLEFEGFKNRDVTAAPTHTRTSLLNSLPGYRLSSNSTSSRNSSVSRKTKIGACLSPGT